jgi:hypothetical protein
MSGPNADSGRFHLTKRIYVAILLVAVIVAGVLVYVYYSMSVTAVTSVKIVQVLADRKVLNGTYPNRNAIFLFEVRVWSTAQSISIKLDKPVFLVDIDGVHLGNQTLDGGTIFPGSYLTYDFRFTVTESQAGYIPFSYSADNIYLGMVTRLTAGFYSQPVAMCHSVTWNWTTALPIVDYGSYSRCVP